MEPTPPINEGDNEGSNIRNRILFIRTHNNGFSNMNIIGNGTRASISMPVNMGMTIPISNLFFNNTDLDDVMSRSLEEKEAIKKPMCKSFIDGLSKIKIESDDELSCAICQDTFKVGDDVLELPCENGSHFFHYEEGECPGIKPWLEQNNTCPVCRHEFPSEPEPEPEPGSEPEPEPESGNDEPQQIINNEELENIAENIMNNAMNNMMRNYIERAFEDLEDRDLDEAIRRSLEDI